VRHSVNSNASCCLHAFAVSFPLYVRVVVLDTADNSTCSCVSVVVLDTAGDSTCSCVSVVVLDTADNSTYSCVSVVVLDTTDNSTCSCVSVVVLDTAENSTCSCSGCCSFLIHFDLCLLDHIGNVQVLLWDPTQICSRSEDVCQIKLRSKSTSYSNSCLVLLPIASCRIFILLTATSKWAVLSSPFLTRIVTHI
jgi:hypothetical protein